jgi:hypothetical protein
MEGCPAAVLVREGMPVGDLPEEGGESPVRSGLGEVSPWRLSWRADPKLRALADRHYNRQKIGADQFVPPVRCLCLITDDETAGWVTSWPFAEYAHHDWAGAWVNQLFRNEGAYRSSDLIRWAIAHSRVKWPAVPELGIVTFVDAGKTEPKEVPGWCYIRAGWSHAGFTKTEGLHVFQQLPDRRISRRSKPMPMPSPVPGWQHSLFDELEAS